MIKKNWIWFGVFVISGLLVGVLFKVFPKVYRNEAYAIGVARIINIEKEVDEGKIFYTYDYQYEIPESIAVDVSGNLIKGPIVQATLSQRKPKYPQTVRIKYMKEEPIIFEFLDPLSFED